MSIANFAEHLNYPGDTVVVAFASGAMDHPEWGATLRRLEVPHVLCWDATGRWYQDGVPGMDGRDETANQLAGWPANIRTVALGTSGGAYGALLYGLLAGMDEVIAISPVTGNGQAAIEDFGAEWEHRLDGDPGNDLLDLKTLYRGASRHPKATAFYSDGDGTELDRGMIYRLPLEEYNVTLVPGFSHAGLAKGLRDRGTIARALRG